MDSDVASPIVELRQYTLLPLQRDILIGLFEREFIEAQETLGIEVIGQFRDLDAPDRFVWLRGFEDMPSRAYALQAFYSGPAWKTHREAANATMIDSDNVLLLRPARSNSGFDLRPGERAPRATAGDGPGLVIARVYSLDEGGDQSCVEVFERVMKPSLHDAGAEVLAYFRTEIVQNTFPNLPVRENENVFVWFASIAPDHDAATGWVELDELEDLLRDPPGLGRRLQTLRLRPTARSLLTGASPACPATSPGQR